ncbi:MAG: hypothetical protein IJL54_02095 [Prevotella sp.]|nr:hypothetical protein [Prevotella sp.]
MKLPNLFKLTLGSLVILIGLFLLVRHNEQTKRQQMEEEAARMEMENSLLDEDIYTLPHDCDGNGRVYDDCIWDFGQY